MDEIPELLEKLSNCSWLEEINTVESIRKKIPHCTVRHLASIISKNKTWVGVSLELAQGIRVYPQLSKCLNRNLAYQSLKRKQKLRKYAEA